MSMASTLIERESMNPENEGVFVAKDSHEEVGTGSGEKPWEVRIGRLDEVFAPRIAARKEV
jgi:hypothetical protein